MRSASNETEVGVAHTDRRSPLLGADLASNELDGATLHVWVLHVGDCGVDELSAHLDDLESRRAAAVARLADRRRYVFSHVALRHVLASYLNLSPKDVAFTRAPCPACGGRNGPPVLKGNRSVRFSLSARDDLVVIGVATTPVGVDVERVPGRETVDAVSVLLHPAERAEIGAATLSERGRVFARLWTRKEAYLKGRGVGLAHGLASEYLGSDGRAGGPPDWHVVRVPVTPPYQAAAAVGVEPPSHREPRARPPTSVAYFGAHWDTGGGLVGSSMESCITTASVPEGW